MNLLIAALALGFALASSALAQDPGGRGVPAVLERLSGSDNHHEERIVTMSTATHSPEAKIPPLDAAVPARTETATFGLG